MKVRITYTNGMYDVIDTDSKLTTNDIAAMRGDAGAAIETRQRMRFDRLTDFEDGRSDGLWLEIYYAKYQMGQPETNVDGDASVTAKMPTIEGWNPYCKILQVSSEEMKHIAKITSSREDGSGADFGAQLEFCRVQTDEGKSELISFAKMHAYLDLFGFTGGRASAAALVYESFVAWCTMSGVPTNIEYLSNAAKALGFPAEPFREYIETMLKEDGKTKKADTTSA